MNTRLKKTFRRGFGYEFCGLDCYNDSVFTDVCIAVTTRINACSHYWLMFVYED